MKTKHIFFLLLCVGVFLFVGYGFAMRKQADNVVPAELLEKTKSISLSPITTKKPSYGFSNLPSLPKTMRMYETQERQLSDVSKYLAPLGFTGKPTQTTGTKGVVYIWSEKNTTATYSESSDTITYSVMSSSASGTINITPEKASLIAAAFIKTLMGETQIIPRESVQLYFSIRQQDITPVTKIEQANAVEIHYNYILNNLLIVGPQAGYPSLSVRLNTAGDIIGFTFVPPPVVRETTKEIPILSSQDVITQLKQGEGAIVRYFYTSGGDEPVYLQEPPDAIQVSSITPSYFYTPTSGVLAPVIIITGKGKVNNKITEVTTVLPATR